MNKLRLIVLGLAAYTACASLASADPDQWQGSSIADSYAERGPQMTVLGGPQEDRVTAEFDAGEYVIVDRPAIAAGVNCSPIDAVTVRCERFNFPNWHDRFAVLLGGGDDTFRMSIPWRSGDFNGQGGDDKLIGSAADSDLFGGGGEDLLRGKAGPDRLFGFPGHDRLYGGAGDDRLDTADSDRDRVIDCGPGDDKAFVDLRGLDPKPKHCERVRAIEDPR